MHLKSLYYLTARNPLHYWPLTKSYPGGKNFLCRGCVIYQSDTSARRYYPTSFSGEFDFSSVPKRFLFGTVAWSGFAPTGKDIQVEITCGDTAISFCTNGQPRNFANQPHPIFGRLLNSSSRVEFTIKFAKCQVNVASEPFETSRLEQIQIYLLRLQPEILCHVR